MTPHPRPLSRVRERGDGSRGEGRAFEAKIKEWYQQRSKSTGKKV